MKIPVESFPFVKKLTAEIETVSKTWWAIFLTVFAFWLFGVFALVNQILYGHEVTGMRDYVVWGGYIVNFIFFMGLSYAGALLSGGMHLFKARLRTPIIRISELVTVISLLIGPMFIMFCIGRLERLPYLVMYPRIQSPITWDVIAISTDIIGCLIFLYLSFIEDFAFLRDYDDLKVPAWKKKLYTVLSLNYRATENQKKTIKMAKNIMAAMIIAIAIIVYSVLAWIFGVTLQPGWHSTIFGPYFVIAAIYSGTGLVILLMWIFRKIYHLEDLITLKHFQFTGLILLIAASFYGYFTFSDYLTKWYGSIKMDKLLIDKLFNDYFWLFLFSNYFGILLPIVIMGFKKLRTIPNITLSALITIVALWVNRYLIIVPTLETPYIPIQDSRPEWIHYSSTWVEWGIMGGGISLFILLFMIASKLVPIISISDLMEEDAVQPDKE